MFTSLSDVTAYQYSTSGFSNVLLKRDSFAPPGYVKYEYHHYVNQTLTIPEVKQINAILANETNLELLFTISHNVTGSFSPNIDADYSLISVASHELLKRRNAANTATIGIGLAKMIIAYGKFGALHANNVFCQQALPCPPPIASSMSFFPTISATQYTAAAVYLDTLMTQLGSRRNVTTIQLLSMPDTYEETNTTTNATDVSPLDSCKDTSSSQSSYVMTSKEVLVHPTGREMIITKDPPYWNYKVNDFAYAITRNWSRHDGNNENASIFSLKNDFTLLGNDGVTKTLIMGGNDIIPFYARSFGGMVRNITYQKFKSCPLSEDNSSFPEDEICRTAFNTGDVNISLIKTSVNIMNETVNEEFGLKPYVRSIGDQFVPLFKNGVDSDIECEARRAIYDGRLGDVVFWDLIEKVTLESITDSKSIPVCRYELTQQSYKDTVANLDQDAKATIPGFLNIRPSSKYKIISSTIVDNKIIEERQMYGPPSFLADKQMNEGKELAKFDGLDPTSQLHGSYFSIEMVSGNVMASVKRSANYIRLERSALFPDLKESYYMFPTISSSYGQKALDSQIKERAKLISLFRIFSIAFVLGGFGIGLMCVILGLCLCSRNRAHVKPQ